jgi:hypothetical protein
MSDTMINITSHGEKYFKKAFEFSQYKAKGYKIKENCFILYWTESDDEDYISFPYEMEMDQASSFIYNWLKQSDYPQEPDHDGNNSKGWRVFNESWGNVGGDWKTFLAVMPVWIIHPK